MATVVVDPVTRIEGHLKVEVEVDGGKVVDARSTGTMYRGFEQLLVGKDPRDALRVTQRVCGVCNAIHGITSALCIDNAFGAEVPDAGRIIRNIIFASQWLGDHPLHFYHLSALDYLDVTAVANYKGNDPALLGVKDKVVNLVMAKDTYPLTPRYEPDEFTLSDPEIVTSAVAHYLQALEIRRLAHEMMALWGGRVPFFQNVVAGGVGIRPTVSRIFETQWRLEKVADFIENIYAKDVVGLGTGPLKPLHDLKVGFGVGNFISWGVFDQGKSGEVSVENRSFMKPGIITDLDLANIEIPDVEKVAEDVKYSWYKSESGLNPKEGETDPDPRKEGAYSWVKAPRYDGKPMEGGPLARMLIMQEPGFMKLAETIGVWPSAVARHAARAYETVLLAAEFKKWLAELADIVAKDPYASVCDDKPVPDKAEGYGVVDAPRSANGHWITIEGGKIKRYQLVVASTWNLCPRDDQGQRGPVEEALIGIPVPDPENPTNVVRVIRSFDPCLACSVHLIHPESNRILEFRVT